MLDSESHSGAQGTAIDHTDLPFVPTGEPLIPQEVYIDVLNPGQGPCRALEGQTAGSGNGYVAAKDVEPHVWDHLVRLDGEVRLRQEHDLQAGTDTPGVDPDLTGIGHVP